MEPGRRRALAHQVEPLMNRIVRTDQQLRSGPDQLCRRPKHHLAHGIPLVAVYQTLIDAERKIVQRDLWTSQGAEQRGCFERNRPVAECGALCANRDDADVSHIRSMSSSTTRGARARQAREAGRY